MTNTEATAPPATPVTWISSLFTSPRSSRRNGPEDASGVALFVGDSSILQSPPPHEIKLVTPGGSKNMDTVTPLLTRSSPVSSALELNREQLSGEAEAEGIAAESVDVCAAMAQVKTYLEHTQVFAVEQSKLALEHCKIYLQCGRKVLNQASQSPSFVAAFFYFNVLWSLVGIVRYFVVKATPIHLATPTATFMIDSFMEKTCPAECAVTLETMAQARSDIETNVRRVWRPSEILALAMQQINAGQTILQRVHAEYEALVAELEKDSNLCRFPFAHALNPLCPPAAFDTEAFVGSMALL